MLGVAAIPSLLYTVFCFGIPESPRWLLVRKGDRQKGVEILRLIEPQASPAEIETRANEIVASISENVSSGRFWTRRLRVAHPARVPDCLLQPTLWHQRHPLFCAAHFRTNRAGCEGGAAPVRRHRRDQSHLHFRRSMAH